MDYIPEQIKERVGLAEAVELYTGERLIKNKMRCPLHNEKTASFTVYSNGKYYCFGCGASGDIIGFVMAYLGLDYRQAIGKLDSDFNLGLSQRPTFSQHRRLQREAERQRKERQQQKERADRLDTAYWQAFDKVLYYERIIEQYRPTSPEAEPPPEFIRALQNIEYARHLLDCAENERRLFKQ